MNLVLALAAAAMAATAVGLLLRRLIFVTRVESWSMAPTMTPGQLLLTRRSFRTVRRGDVVVADSVELGRPIVKRVVGLGGERVQVSPTGVRVDGAVLAEPYVVRAGGRSGGFEVPAGQLLLLGDNRAASDDSRSWKQPYLSARSVRGVVLSRRPTVATPADPAPRPGRVVRAG